MSLACSACAQLYRTWTGGVCPRCGNKAILNMASGQRAAVTARYLELLEAQKRPITTGMGREEEMRALFGDPLE